VSAAATARLIAMPENCDEAGEPRVALIVTPPPTCINRRPILRVFGSITAAIAAKRSVETGR
jgi:hypothetical protein